MRVKKKYVPALIIITLISCVGLLLAISNIFPNDLDFIAVSKTTNISIHNKANDSLIVLTKEEDIAIFERVLKDYSKRLRFSEEKPFKGNYYTITFQDADLLTSHFNLGHSQSGWTLYFNTNLLGTQIKQTGFKYSKTFLNDSFGHYIMNSLPSHNLQINKRIK
jgi:hypothetical protein